MSRSNHGPDRDAAHALNEPGGEWIWAFWARSHAETMTVYYEFVSYEKYLVKSDVEHQPYSRAACERQRIVETRVRALIGTRRNPWG